MSGLCLFAPIGGHCASVFVCLVDYNRNDFVDSSGVVAFAIVDL